MASVAYAIEGPQEDLKKILGAICLAMIDKKHWTEYNVCEHLGFTEQELDDKRLGGKIEDEPTFDDGVLRFWAEERWGLQDFEELLRQKFPDIKVYWTVEECGCEIYCTNDKEGKYFEGKVYVDTCINDNYQSDYFKSLEDALKWISNLTDGKIKTEEDIDTFNEESADSDDFIGLYKFKFVD